MNEHDITIPAPVEVDKDSFLPADTLSYFHRLSNLEPIKKSTSLEHVEHLQKEINQENLEQALDEVRFYKKLRLAEIRKEDLSGRLAREEVLIKISNLAESILFITQNLALAETAKKYGLPFWQDADLGRHLNEIAVIAMGKLAGHEINYGSDLDLIFVYAYDGSSTGNKPLSSNEWFAKFVQKLIAFLTIMTRAGAAYTIDTDLRPSGRAGTLVTSFQSFIDYQSHQAQLWEKQALLKSRVLFMDSVFKQNLAWHLVKQVDVHRLYPQLAQEIYTMKKKIEGQRQKNNSWHYKYGAGGLMDIEFLVQYYQIKLGMIYHQIRTPSTYAALREMKKTKIFLPKEIELLERAHDFYRTFESHRFFIDDHMQISESSESFQKYCDLMGWTSSKIGIELFQDLSQNVASLFAKHLGQQYA